MIALNFRFGPYYSPAPLLLWSVDAIRKTEYHPHEYVSVVLERKMGSGSIGRVFAGRIDRDRSFRAPQLGSFIVKIADDFNKSQRLRHEYRVYRHLHDRGVTGIPFLLGFYENTDVNICSLLLSNVGRPLGELMDADRMLHLSVSQKYRSSLRH